MKSIIGASLLLVAIASCGSQQNAARNFHIENSSNYNGVYKILFDSLAKSEKTFLEVSRGDNKLFASGAYHSVVAVQTRNEQIMEVVVNNLCNTGLVLFRHKPDERIIARLKEDEDRRFSLTLLSDTVLAYANAKNDLFYNKCLWAVLQND